MRGSGYLNANKGALFAAQVQATENQRKNRWKVCWQCQKEKNTLGGKLVLRPGLHMFVCADCLSANELKKEHK